MNRLSEEFGRYHRQMLLPGVGRAGQERLARSHAVVVGCGALGTVAAEQLARAGVGRLTLIDRDVVEWTNLQRQVLFREADAAAGTPKAIAAAARLAEVNSAIELRPRVADVNPRTVEELCAGADVVVDGTDNFQTRYLLNDACVKHGWPLVYGGVVGTVGMTMTVVGEVAGRGDGASGEWGVEARSGPERSDRGIRTCCLRCVFPEMPEPGAAATCDTAGVLGPMVGVVASIQAAEAMKVLLGRFDLLRPVLSQFDIWNNVRRTIDLTTIDRSGCVCCGRRRFEFLEGAAEEITTICGTDSVQVLPGSAARVDLETLAARLRPHGEFEVTRYVVRGVLREWPGLRLTVFGDGRAMVHGTGDGVQAKSLYARYVGA